jgi:hypothetical protein
MAKSGQVGLDQIALTRQGLDGTFDSQATDTVKKPGNVQGLSCILYK